MALAPLGSFRDRVDRRASHDRAGPCCSGRACPSGYLSDCQVAARFGLRALGRVIRMVNRASALEMDSANIYVLSRLRD